MQTSLFNYVTKMALLGVKKITLFHVQDKSRISEYPEDSLAKLNEIDNARLQDMKNILQEKAIAEVDTFLSYGSPAVEILKLIRERNIQLVVMGSQGRGVCASVKGPKADGIAYPKVARYNDHIIVKEKDVSLKNDPALTGS